MWKGDERSSLSSTLLTGWGMIGLVFLHPADGVQDVGEVAVVAPDSLPVLVQDPLVLGAYCTPSRFLIFFKQGPVRHRNVNTQKAHPEKHGGYRLGWHRDGNQPLAGPHPDPDTSYETLHGSLDVNLLETRNKKHAIAEMYHKS
jgi:hypothetical protein